MRAVFLAIALAFSLGNASENAASEATNDAIQALVDKGETAQAFEMARTVAQDGDARAHEWLGWFYEEGAGVEYDLNRAIYHYRIALDGGKNYARWRIGVLIDEGKAEGTLEEAVELFRLAAAENFTNAQVSLAVMNATGRGTPVDYEASLTNYMLAAQAGNIHGIQGVGVLFALGQGVPQDFEEAAAWFLAAWSVGSETGEANFNRVIQDMHPADVAMVGLRAQEIADELGLGVDINLLSDKPFQPKDPA